MDGHRDKNSETFAVVALGQIEAKHSPRKSPCRSSGGARFHDETSGASRDCTSLQQERAVLDSSTSPSEKIAFVQGLMLFSDVSPADCSTIISGAREKRYWRWQTIFSEGDPVLHVVLLLSGYVKITQLGPRSNEVILRLSGIGDVVGGFGRWSDYKHCSTAQAVRPCTALVWDAATFEKLLERFDLLRRNTVRALEERLQEMEQRFREVSTENVGSRLSSELIRLSKQFGCNVSGHREICLSRTELAQLTGMTPSTVSRLLCRWEALGIVSIGREMVEVRDITALARSTAGG